VGQIARLALSYAALLFLTLIFVAPLLWMLSTSFKTNVEATTLPLNFLPNEPSTYGYDTILNSAGTPVLRWFVNSMVAAAAHAVLVLATAAPAAYALARMEFRGKRIFFAAIIGTLFIPQFLFLVPNYAIVDTFGWLDTLLAIIVPGAAGAFGVFFLRQFFLALPEELEEAALLDGANRFQIFARIVLPLSKPALATLALLSFLTNYNDFLWPIYVLFNPESLTLPPGLALLGFSYQTDYAVIMAGGVIASIPVLIVFLIAQRYVIEGIARSGIKG
jgi:multiple sugar transport system permease protein